MMGMGMGKEMERSGVLALSMVRESSIGDVDNPWYLTIPGCVGAGTAALLVVTAIGLSSRRRSQG